MSKFNYKFVLTAILLLLTPIVVFAGKFREFSPTPSADGGNIVSTNTFKQLIELAPATTDYSVWLVIILTLAFIVLGLGLLLRVVPKRLQAQQA